MDEKEAFNSSSPEAMDFRRQLREQGLSAPPSVSMVETMRARGENVEGVPTFQEAMTHRDYLIAHAPPVPHSVTEAVIRKFKETCEQQLELEKALSVWMADWAGRWADAVLAQR